jgi:hypothetical protein
VSMFTEKYTDNDFLKVLEGEPKTIGFVAKSVGAARATTVVWLKKLEQAGEVKKISIDDGAMHVWVKSN